MTNVLTAHQRNIDDQIIGRARALHPLLNEHAAAMEQLRRLPDVVSGGLERDGMFRLFTPTCFGGYAVGVTTALEVVAALAEADASAGWVVAIAAIGSWIGAHSSVQAQGEIFGSGPDVRIAGSLSPLPAQKVHGGLRVTGSWPYASGAHDADWAVLCASIVGEAADAEEIFLCFVPVEEVTLRQTWYTVGMRGTGSDSWHADDVFVPTYRTIPAAEIADGSSTSIYDEPIFRVPLLSAGTLLELGTLLGTGKAALDFVAERTLTKPLHNTCFARQCDSAGVQMQIAEAAVKIATARLHAFDIATAIDHASAENRVSAYAVRAEWKARISYAAQQIVEALNILMNVHGAGSFAESTRLQQYWRDTNTAARHASLQIAVGYEVYGESLLGVEQRITAFV
jgi:3-hydroxy-9,10-secoandrosta-1,3,5(10)-triene-9,17-dione monooxygenase